MTKKTCLALIVIWLFSASAVVVAQTNQPDQSEPTPKFQNGIVVDKDLLAVTSDGRLIRHSFQWGSQREYGTLDRTLAPYMDVVNDKAYVSTNEEVLEIDLASGEILRAANHGVGMGRIGVIDGQRVFIHNGATLEIIDLDSKTTLHTIELGEESALQQLRPDEFPQTRNEHLLYVASRNGAEIAEVDLNSGQVVRRLDSAFRSSTGLHIVGDTLFACHLNVSYGIIHESMSATNLATLEQRAIELPGRRDRQSKRLQMLDKSYVGISMASSQDGGFCVSALHGIFQFDSDGELVARAEPLQPGQALVAATANSAIVSHPNGVTAASFITVDTATNQDERR